MIPAYILDGVRTPRASVRKSNSLYTGVHPQELFAQTLSGLASRPKFNGDDVESLYVGCVTQVKEQGANLARNAALSAGWPVSVPAMTLNMYCGSALQAINLAAMAVMSGSMHLAVGGGVESMSRVPMFSDGAELDGLNPALRKRWKQVPQGISADLLATQENFSRAELDDFSLQSHKKAVAAIEARRFDNSLTYIKDGDGTVLLKEDNHARADTSMAKLADLKPAFVEMGREYDGIALERFKDIKEIRHVHTAGSSSGIADGAAAVAICSADYALANGIKPRALVRSVSAIGSDPILMLTGPTVCSIRALEKAGLEASDIQLWEINEAFAAVPLQTMKNLGIAPEIVNVNGGAIALGHPLGATGGILLLTLLDEMERRDLQLGAVTLCIAGGQSVAAVIERV
ncbi:MAG TPA: acetyl-CoA C-acyltransferase [Chroococcales cyanobacterium]